MRTPGWQPRERASTPSESSSQTQSSSIHISPLHRRLYRYFSFSSSFSSPFFLFSLDSALVWCPILQPLKHPTLTARFAFSLFSKTPCFSRSRFSTARSSSRHHHRHHQSAKGDDDDDDASSGKPSFVLFFETTTTPTSRRPKPLRCGESKVALLLFSMWATKTMMIPTTTTTFSWVVVVVVLARVRTCTAGNPPSCSFYVKQQSKDTSKSSKRSLSFSLSFLCVLFRVLKCEMLKP